MHTYAKMPIEDIVENANNARKHSSAQIELLQDSLERYGFVNPLVVDEHHNLVAGHGRLAAARAAGLDLVPVLVLEGLGPQEVREYAIADNKLPLLASWDYELLQAEFLDLGDLGVDLGKLGWSESEQDIITRAEWKPLTVEGADKEGEEEADRTTALGGTVRFSPATWELILECIQDTPTPADHEAALLHICQAWCSE